jgi:WD40 repeat protein
VKIWDTRASTGSAIRTFSGHTDVVRDVAISPDGRWIASAGNEGVVKIWELDTCKIIKELPQHLPGSKH